MVEKISNVSKIPITTKRDRYLGTPAINGRMYSGLYQLLLDWIGERMEGWKTKYLSYAGRIILVQSILTTLPLYPMQSSIVPINLCNSIDRMVRKFQWGGSNDNKKIHLIKWETVTNEKEQWGLGLKTDDAFSIGTGMEHAGIVGPVC